MYLVDRIINTFRRTNDSSDNLTGLIIDNKIDAGESKDCFYRYLINGVLIFMATYGSLTCYATAFSIEFYKPIVFIILLIISVMYAYIHLNKRVRKIGYVIAFVLYVVIVVEFRIRIKSGFANMVNTTLEYMENIFVLPIIKRYSEYASNSRLSVTVCLIVIGFVMALLLNIIISEFMSVWGLLIVTIPISQIGLYFDLMPDYISYFMVIISIITVMAIKMTRRYIISENEISYSCKQKNGQNILKYGTEPLVVAQHALTLAALAIGVILIVTPFVLISNYGEGVSNKKIKRSTNVYVRNFAISGLAGLFGNKDGAGGISGGRLGDVNVVRLDYKTDLEVTYVPISTDRMYLRAYIGSVYKDNSWLPFSNVYGSSYINNNMDNDWNINSYDMYNMTSSILKWDFDNSAGLQDIEGKMNVKNVDANKQYSYEPYYSISNNEYSKVFSDDSLRMEMMLDSYDATYYPNNRGDELRLDSLSYNEKLNSIAVEKSVKKNSSDYIDLIMYDSLVRRIYREVPEINYEVIKKICKDNGIDRYDDMKTKINKVIKLFDEQYEYSLKCGKTPKNTDFVNYFLTGNKSGYCAHFASAATLMFRYLRIPARYVEGYVIDEEDVIDGEKLDVPVSDYLQAKDKSFTKKLGVKKVSVNDSSAHAWVEVYYSGYGWAPIEVTPASDGDDYDAGAGGGLLESFLSLFDTPDEKKNDGGSKNVSANTLEEIKTNGKKALEYVGYILIAAVIGWMIKLITINIRRNSSFNNEDIDKAVESMYMYLLNVMAYSGVIRKPGSTNAEYHKELAKLSYIEYEDLNNIYKCIMPAGYSEESVKKEDYINMKESVNKIVKNSYKELGIMKRFSFRFIRNLG